MNSPIWRESIARNLTRICIDRGWLWKGDVLIAGLEELENVDASEIYPRRISAMETLIRQKGDEFIFPFADGTGNLSGRDYEFREPSAIRENAVRSGRLRGEFQGELEESQPTELEDGAEARADFRSIQDDFVCNKSVFFFALTVMDKVLAWNWHRKGTGSRFAACMWIYTKAVLWDQRMRPRMVTNQDGRQRLEGDLEQRMHAIVESWNCVCEDLYQRRTRVVDTIDTVRVGRGYLGGPGLQS